MSAAPSRAMWKFMLQLVDGEQIVHTMPDGALVHAVAMQHGVLCVWVEVEPQLLPRARRFVVYGTGHSIAAGHVYRGTALNGSFVWHVFEVVS